MLRMAKLTDYGIVLLSQFAVRQDATPMTAREISSQARLPLPTVGKLLKQLSHGGLLSSQRGTKGGYFLARAAREITVAQIIEVLEGPMALTECQAPGVCDQERFCSVKPNWLVINRTVRDALSNVTLADMARPVRPVFAISPSPGPHTGRTLPRSPV